MDRHDDGTATPVLESLREITGSEFRATHAVNPIPRERPPAVGLGVRRPQQQERFWAAVIRQGL